MTMFAPPTDTGQAQAERPVQNLVLAADDPRHGTNVGYKSCRCRCGTCRRAMALGANLYKMRRAANGGRRLDVDKLGSVRRLQALMAMGWTRRELARRAGYQGDAFAPILNSPRQVLRAETAAKILDLYDRLSMTHGPSSSGRIRAASRGWPPPLAWNNIDDPDENPVDWKYNGTNDRHADLDDCLSNGFHLSEVCRALGLTFTALEKWCDRNGRRDDFNRLLARERGVA